MELSNEEKKLYSSHDELLTACRMILLSGVIPAERKDLIKTLSLAVSNGDDVEIQILLSNNTL